MLGAVVLIAIILALVGFAIWAGSGGETHGADYNATGTQQYWQMH